ncbi:MAG: SAM-dependent methyltransferase [Saprospiraceae bacterium]|nr:SAM-dependent methyltransferase [Saprospiraceae bacterium]
MKNVFARLVHLKEESVLSFTLRYTSRDEVKNHPIEEAIAMISLWLGDEFLNADLFTTVQDHSLQFNKKRKARLFSKKPSHTQAPSTAHDKQKQRLIDPIRAKYLHPMGITGKDGQILKTGQKKFRQINKYIEIIDSLIDQGELGASPHLVDMGSGKGYLTFALYDHLVNNRKLEASITGIELRPKLVSFCNELAQEVGFDRLKFLAMNIEEYQPEKIDMLIALHACDIATDIAIAKGIKAQSSFIVVAPCCHKQIRKQMQCQTALQSVLKHGIMEERQAELVTDGIRSLLLEANGYKTKVFEFISTEHTPKNVMITATQGTGREDALEQIDQIKKDFGIEYHYLEKLL